MQSLPQQVALIALLTASVPALAGAGPPARVVAHVNGAAITSDRLDRATSTLIPLESFHRNVAGEKLAALRQKALDGLVNEELEYQDAVRRGLRVLHGGANADARRALTIKRAFDRVVTARCQVNQGEARQFFDEHPDRFVEPEQLHLSAITVAVNPSSGAAQWDAARIRAADVRKQLDEGAAFADLGGTDMGLVHRGSLAAAFEQAVKDLPAGASSGVVETIYGYHIVRVLEILPPQKKTFDEVGAKLQKDLAGQRCDEVRDAWVASLRARATLVFPE